jgi:hypothetical protein
MFVVLSPRSARIAKKLTFWPNQGLRSPEARTRRIRAIVALTALVLGHQAVASAAAPASIASVAAHARASLRRTVKKAASRHAESDAALGARIVAYARQQTGRQVGDGECYDLADQALLSSGARSASSFDDVTPGGDYMWGKPVALQYVRPGDILQFRDFSVRTSVMTRESMPGGGSYATQSSMVDQRPHHTAIVESNDGRTLVVLEQNVPPLGRVVQRNRIPIASMTYDGDASGQARGMATTTVRVDGTIKAYRPQRAAPADPQLSAR